MAAYTYTKINWENEPSYNTPINETNLNHMDQGIFDLAYVKAEKEDAVFVNSISLDRKAGTSVGLDSVAAGYDTEASGPSSVAIGTNTSAKNGQAVAGGFNSKAWGNTSLAFGTNCITRLNSSESVALGNNCIAGSANQMVFGQYNVEDTTGTYAEIVGNGSSGNESNARTLDWEGNETIAGDYTNGNGETLHGAYQAFIDGLPVDSESGNPCVITDAFNTDAKSVKLTLNPIQSGSGTPSPSNVRSISGRTQSVIYRYGKNLFNASAIVRRYVSDPQTRLETGSIVKVTLGDKLVFSTDYSGIQFGVIFFDDAAKTTNIEDSGWLNPNTTYTVRHDGFICLGSIGIRNSDNSAFSDADIANIKNAHTQLEIGSTATAYEPYNGESITRTYGQTVYGAEDHVTGDGATNKFGYIEYDGSDDEVMSLTGNRVAIQCPSDSITNSSELTITGKLFSNRFVEKTNAETFGGQVGFHFRATGSHEIVLSLGANGFTTVAEWRTWLSQNPVQVIYGLATPTSIPLTAQNLPLLKGDNVITTDADSINTEYAADIALYIAKKIAEGSQNNRSLSKGGSGDEEPKEEEKEVVEIKEEEPLNKEVR